MRCRCGYMLRCRKLVSSMSISAIGPGGEQSRRHGGSEERLGCTDSEEHFGRTANWMAACRSIPSINRLLLWLAPRVSPYVLLYTWDKHTSS
eukprot:232571-Prymnesium_polylepis.2